MKTVFFDVDTQYDFLLPAGALSVPGAARILPAVAQLNRWAAANGIVVVSTMDAHTESDQEFQIWPGHCVAGTLGQRKHDSTLLERRVTVPSYRTSFELAGAQQVIIEKQSLNCFENANLNAVLDALSADRYVVYGVVTEYCIALAARGLLQTGKRVEIVTNAVETLRREDGDAALHAFAEAGGRLTSLSEIVAPTTAARA
jgi:nicotinamidase/pyrazinamidase